MAKSFKIISITASIFLFIVFLFFNYGISLESRSKNGKLFFSDYFYPLNGFPSGFDLNERSLIANKLRESNKFKKSQLYEYDMNFYCVAGRLHSTVMIYNVVNENEQLEIIELAHRIKKQYGTRDFSIEFYLMQSGIPDRDELIRKVRIR